MEAALHKEIRAAGRTVLKQPVACKRAILNFLEYLFISFFVSSVMIRGPTI